MSEHAVRTRPIPAEPAARPNGWWGAALFVAGEATLFGVLFGSYYYLRFHTLHWPPTGTAEPETVVPLVLTGVLVTMSLPIQLAWRAARARRLRTAWSLLALAFVVQCGYFAFEMHDFIGQVGSLKPTSSAYASIYYTLLGADHAHVFIGILFSLFVLLRTAGGLTSYRLVGFRALTFYWHAVNVLTLLTVGCLLSASI